jgi:hypothetical protein
MKSGLPDDSDPKQHPTGDGEHRGDGQQELVVVADHE